MDWQQGRGGSLLPNLDTLPWINEAHWQDQVRNQPGKRPLNFSRFGGLGAGRMPVGFSGDTLISWESLAYQPYFTATSANVLYGYWSHDIGGHMEGELTPELYVRWLQFGLYSPVLRTHTSKSMECERRVHHFPDPERGIMMAALRRRYELVPYLYGEMRKCADTGLSVVRPMYYEYPEEEEAYRCPNQYMFGDRMIVAPVVGPADAKSESASVRVWLPKGSWMDVARGVELAGGGWIEANYTLEETPVFVRPGTVLPEQSYTRRLHPGSYPDLVFRVFGGTEGACELYEDDGESLDWIRDEAVRLRFSHQKTGSIRVFRLEEAVGGFKTFTPERPVKILVEGMAPPAKVTGAAWSYDGDNAVLILDLGVCDLTKVSEVTVTETAPAYGLKGIMRRLDKVRAYTCQVSPAHPIHAEERLAVRAAQTGNRISRSPETFAGEWAMLWKHLQKLPFALGDYAQAYRRQGMQFETQAELLEHSKRLVEALRLEFNKPTF